MRDEIVFMSREELERYAIELRKQIRNYKVYLYDENGTQYKFETVYKKNYGWWLFHNLVVHPLVGLLPVGLLFRLHEYSSVRMRR